MILKSGSESRDAFVFQQTRYQSMDHVENGMEEMYGSVRHKGQK